MDRREIKSIIEGLLFVWGEPLSIKDICHVLELEEKFLEEVLKEMMEEFDYYRRGIKILRFNDKYQLSTRPEHYQWISKLSQKEDSKSLSAAALETLSIIAYRQPITRNEIEAIRGVRSNKALETLLNKGLIEEKGRLERAGRPIIYGTTDEFLRYFGLESLDELPSLKNFDIENEDIVDLEE
ncbi:MAG: SMC-Scp complex subunit ScpB [Tissierellia bacterium]|nr:SMC-Scp complex subunit ScpB [Tissierellia bacterium]